MITYYAIVNDMLKSQQADPAKPLSPPEHCIWIDLLSPTLEEEHAIEHALGIELPTQEEMAEIEYSSRFYEEKNALYMTASVVSGISVHNPTTAEVTFILTRNWLVTIRYTKLTAFQALEKESSRQPLLHKTTDIIIASLLDYVVNRIADALEKIQVHLNQLSSTIFSEYNTPQTEDLKRTLKQLGKHNSLLAKLSDSLLSIERTITFCRQGTRDWISETAQRQMKSIVYDINSLSEYQEKMNVEVNFLQDATLGLINIEQNSIIKVFSIAAVLFLPPTLVGTIYGMNLKIPEESWEYGYPFSLSLMLLSALGCYAWFKIKRWL